MNSEILNTLNETPHAGMTMLMEKYTGLVWKIVSFHLSNPEDIKECVNDTFTKFYFCKDQFDPEKADISTYLSAIARNLAISRYRKEVSHSHISLNDSISEEDSLLISAESRADLKKAISCLKEDEQKIILMKYYNGMTIQEIASSMSLPYETVKKRHQRSLGKLKRILLCVLITLLIALATACTYKVLRYFDVLPPIFHRFSFDISFEISHKLPEKQQEIAQNIKNHLKDSIKIDDDDEVAADTPVFTIPTPTDTDTPASADNYSYAPGYGINENTEQHPYTLYQSSTVENDDVAISLNNASYINDTLRVELTIYNKTDTQLHFLDYIYYGENKITPFTTTINIDEKTTKHELQYYDPDLINYISTSGEFSVEICNVLIPFTLVPSATETLDDKFYQLENDGGIMAVPRLENGSLIVTIYPLNHGEYKTMPALIRGFFGESEGGEIYVTSADGTKLTGTCVRYRPYNFVPYFEWNFGNAEAGHYTLHIPYLYQYQSVPKDFSMPLDLNNLDSALNTAPYTVPGGTVHLDSYERPELIPGQRIGNSYTIYEEGDTNDYWILRLHYEPTDLEHSIIGIKFGTSCDELPEVQWDTLQSGEARLGYSEIKNDMENGILEVLISCNKKVYDYSTFALTPPVIHYNYDDGILYRWNQEFDLSFSVEESFIEKTE